MTSYPSIAISFPFTEIPPDYQSVRTTMEFGYVQTRAKTTIAPRVYEFTHEHCSITDRATWLAFWSANYGGSGTFNFTDPNTSVVVVCRFLESTSPKIQRTSPNTFTIGPIALEEVL